MTQSAAKLAQRRERYAQMEASLGHHAIGGRLTVVPDDVERIEGDGSPCFNCESRGGCRHRPWMLAR